MTPVQSPLPNGTRVGDWIIDQEVGGGAMGRVYKAHAAEDTEWVCALKELTLKSQDAFTRFKAEARVLRVLQEHADIPDAYGPPFPAEGRYFIAMEWVEGSTLKQATEKTPLSDTENAWMAYKVCGVLTFAHSKNVIHRDLKPANIMGWWGADPKIKVTDFGVAGAMGVASNDGSIVGTELFASWQQMAGNTPNPMMDIYSLGATMYYCATRNDPSNTNARYLPRPYNAQSPEIVRLNLLSAGVNDALAAIIVKAVAHDEKARYQTALEMQVELGRLLGIGGAVPPAPPKPGTSTFNPPTPPPSSQPPNTGTTTGTGTTGSFLPFGKPPPKPKS